MSNQKVKEQFNRQAEKFASWSVSRNTGYLNAYFDFCGIQREDKLLDVACGPGEFTIFCAKRIRQASGIDISDREIIIAREQAKEQRLQNVKFNCSDVEHLPYKDNSYSVVICKSAFHHFINPDIVFKEMVRCCNKEGKISIQDITAYEEDYVNTFFETFDKLVDESHNKAFAVTDFNNLYNKNRIIKTGDYLVSVDLNVNEYIEHASQSQENLKKIKKLLKEGINDQKLKKFLFTKDGDLFFKRHVYMLIGNKAEQ